MNNAAFIPATLSGSDIDAGDAVSSFKLSELPTNGTLYLDEATTVAVDAGTAYAASDNALTLYFKPDPNASGTATFQYTANDGELDSAQAMALIEVEPAFDPLVVFSFNINGATRNSVTISWLTDDPSTSQAQVKNVMTGLIVASADDPTLDTTHTPR